MTLLLSRQLEKVRSTGMHEPNGQNSCESSAMLRLHGEYSADPSAAARFDKNHFVVCNGIDGQITYVSDSIHSILGIEPAELLGRRWQEIVTGFGDDSSRWVGDDITLTLTPEDEEPFIQQCRIRHADGGERILELLTFKIYDEFKNLVETQVVARNITAQSAKQVEQEQRIQGLQEQNAVFASIVARILQEKTPTGVIGTISHELNQMLSAICSYGEAMVYELESNAGKPVQAKPGRPTLKSAASAIVNSARLASGILTSVRTVLEGERQKTECVNLNGLVTRTMTLLATEFHDHDIATSFAVTDRSIEVLVERTQIQQVLLSLLRNAIEAMQQVPEGRKISVQISNEAGFALIAIEDNGCGVSIDDAKQLFVAGKTTKQEGFGIGLAICKQVVSSHGGRIWHSQNRPTGSRFQFTLPLKD